ncbi:hypothetical protein VitviT2T_000943 [Vitis vinifera]|uniref:Reverse transcriptase RNase H-like domain-containing protein n=1 Tax=Vitis vinifera TaxID=29760 RepID=A0ABY9BE72_VITVI|nr:hypothetical protein VitviT2T_000943 [Vitis vinifera]
MIECYCLALVWATRRLRHYMIEYSVHLISRLDPLRYLFNRPALVGRLMRWLVLLTEFDIHYVTQKSIKGSIVADHLASLPVSNGTTIEDDFPDDDVAVVTSLSGTTPYSLVYGIEVVLPVEIEMGSLKVALKQQILEADWAQAQLDQLNLLDERILRATDHVRAYQRKMTHAFKKRVKPRLL